MVSALRNLGIQFISATEAMKNYVRIDIEESNRVQVESAIQNAKLIVPDAVKLNFVDKLAQPFAYLYGGHSLSDGTTGFGVKTSGGTKGIATCGHTIHENNYYFEDDTMYLLTCQQYRLDTYYDLQWFTNASLTVTNNITISQYGDQIPITSIEPYSSQAYGSFVCKYGPYTHWTAGNINSTTATLYWVDDSKDAFIEVYNDYDYTYLARTGDSGCPWFLGQTAWGIHSGGSYDGDWAYYTPVDRVSVLGVSVMTSP